ncbi:hypothetical protein [Actinoplanes sp. TFC3]|uniref:hypothetical protein n=1 Tax=Actinoplanes sp. TFC3 TaxID=1710355 RepID=UPI00082A2419|nr:hypothetical protein [Actinoplanes sp. TFC3]
MTAADDRVLAAVVGNRVLLSVSVDDRERPLWDERELAAAVDGRERPRRGERGLAAVVGGWK